MHNNWQNQQTWLLLSNRPLYTRPKPPSPKRQSALKFFVAAASSRNVNVYAPMWSDPPSFVASFFMSNDEFTFNFSKATKKHSNNAINMIIIKKKKMNLINNNSMMPVKLMPGLIWMPWQQEKYKHIIKSLERKQASQKTKQINNT